MTRLALAVFLLSTTSASADTAFCSEVAERLTLHDEKATAVLLGHFSTEQFHLDGKRLISPSGKVEHITGRRITFRGRTFWPGKIIFRGRAFWPCRD